MKNIEDLYKNNKSKHKVRVRDQSVFILEILLSYASLLLLFSYQRYNIFRLYCCTCDPFSRELCPLKDTYHTNRPSIFYAQCVGLSASRSHETNRKPFLGLYRPLALFGVSLGRVDARTHNIDLHTVNTPHGAHSVCEFFSLSPFSFL